MKKIVVFSSTFPSSDHDPVPAFVKDQVIWLKKLYPDLEIDVLAPHNAYSNTRPYTKHRYFNEYRFHYFWPFKWERLVGRGIQPSLKQNKLLYFELPFLFICEFIALLRYVRKHQPNLIFSWWFTPQGIVGALVAKLTRTEFTFDSQASDVIVLKRVPFAKKIVAAVCKRAYAYTVPSKQTADKLMYFSTDKNRTEIEKKLHIIPLGTSAVAPKPAKVTKLKKKYQLTNKTVILFVGRLVRRKGVDLLIDAFSELAKSDNSLKLIIAGDGQDKKSLEKQVNRLGLSSKVSFTGYVLGDDKYALLSLANVVALPSRNEGDFAEGLPVVFMEAVNYGKVTVVSNVTGAHEAVIDGENGFIFKQNSVKELEDKLKSAISIAQMDDKKFYKSVDVLAKKFEWATVTERRAAVMRLKDI